MATAPHPFGSLGGRGDLVRRHNLGLVLRRVHVAPATRSELTRLSGLNRSTIGALVAELQEHGLVVEDEATAGGQVGRPSPLVRPADGPIVLAVNPEIDAVTVATVRLGGHVQHRERVVFAAPPSVEDAVRAASAAAARLLAASGAGRALIGARIAVPGIVRREDGVVRLAPHLGWRDAPIAAMLSAAIDVPVDAANDAGLGARAEWVFGAGRGVDDLVYLNGGPSGIGGGIISAGLLLGGASGHAGEFGHTAVRRGGVADAVGTRGTLESEVTRRRLLEVLGLAVADQDELESALIGASTDAVTKEVRRQVEALAVTIGNAVNVLNPERIVLGGFLAALAAVAPDLLRAQVAERALPALGENVDIRRAELGSDLLLIGAAELALERLFRAPYAD